MFIGGSLYFCLNLRKWLKIRKVSHLRWYLEAPNELAYSSKSINCAKMFIGGSLFLSRPWKMFKNHKSKSVKVIYGGNKCTSLLLKKCKLRKICLKEEVSISV